MTTDQHSHPTTGFQDTRNSGGNNVDMVGVLEETRQSSLPSAVVMSSSFASPPFVPRSTPPEASTATRTDKGMDADHSNYKVGVNITSFESGNPLSSVISPFIDVSLEKEMVATTPLPMPSKPSLQSTFAPANLSQYEPLLRPRPGPEEEVSFVSSQHVVSATPLAESNRETKSPITSSQDPRQVQVQVQARTLGGYEGDRCHQPSSPEENQNQLQQQQTRQEHRPMMASCTVNVQDSQPQQQPQKDLHLNDYTPFDPQPLSDIIAKHREKNLRTYNEICQGLLDLNVEIHHILGEYLQTRYAVVDARMTGGQADIAQLEREQGDMQNTMVSFLNAMKSAFNIFGSIFRKQGGGGGGDTSY